MTNPKAPDVLAYEEMRRAVDQLNLSRYHAELATSKEDRSRHKAEMAYWETKALAIMETGPSERILNNLHLPIMARSERIFEAYPGL